MKNYNWRCFDSLLFIIEESQEAEEDQTQTVASEGVAIPIINVQNPIIIDRLKKNPK